MHTGSTNDYDDDELIEIKLFRNLNKARYTKQNIFLFQHTQIEKTKFSYKNSVCISHIPTYLTGLCSLPL